MAKAKTIPAVKARIHLGEIMKEVFKRGKHFIVEKSGIPMIAILSANEYTKLIQEKEERFKILDRIKAKIPDIPFNEVEEDVNQTIQKVRKQNA